MTGKKRKVAVFDIDGTIFRSSLLIELLDGLIMEGIFPDSARKIFAGKRQNWIDRKGSYEDYINRIIAVYGKFIKGIKAEKVWEVAKKVVAFHKNRVYRFTRDLVFDLKKNYYLLGISGSPRQMVKLFGDEIGFDKVYGRIFETDSKGRLTGKILYEELIENKGKILMRAVEKEKLNLKDSIGVGDTESDIPFLELVDCPIVFNPNLKLYQYALKNRWPIVVERKDVVYGICPQKLPKEIKKLLSCSSRSEE